MIKQMVGKLSIASVDQHLGMHREVLGTLGEL